ncbi:MAG: DUF4373 domain-containing protein [Bacteroidales bacterium]|nr:DUF4373 domain-containing protein [Bacteroidales bacterium]
MSRIAERGLDYTYLDVNFLSDKKIRRLKRRAGNTAPYIFIALLGVIFKEGYYIQWDEDAILDLADSTGFEEEFITKAVSACVEVGLFSKEMFDEHNILTSSGIQKQYNFSCQKMKRKSKVEEYSLLIPSEEKPISSERIPIPSEEMPINSENMPHKIGIGKGIGNNSIEEDIKEDSSYSSSFPPSVEKSEAEKQKEKFLSYMFFQNWAAPNKELEKFIAYNNTGGRKWSKMSKAERESALILWKQEPEQQKRFGTVYLTFWQKIYEKMEELNAPHSVVINALSDCINFTEKDSTTTILCPEDVRNFIECNLQNGIREIINRYVFQPRRTNKIMYKIPL